MLRYNPETGDLVWKITLSPKGQAGCVTGSITKKGYRTVGLDRKVVKAHKICWALHYGEFATAVIDHIDGDGTNNKITNLRLATSVSNAYNAKRSKNNTSGVKGVSWDNTRNKWRAMISVNKVRKTLGYFDNFETAVGILAEYRLQHHGEYTNHG